MQERRWDESQRDRIVAIVAPLAGIGAAKLAVIDDLGRVRTMPLPQIRAGTESLDNGSTFRYEWPALAVADGGTRAVVVSTGGTIVDPRNWSTRRVDSESVDVAFNGAVLLAFGNGLAGYDWNGTLRFTLFEGVQLRPACIAGSYAYFGAGRHYTTVDTWTGSVVRTVDTSVPTFPAAFSSY